MTLIIEKGEINVATIAKTALITKKEPIPEVAVTDVTTTNSTPQVSKPAPAKKMGGWGRFKAAAGDGGGSSTATAAAPATTSSKSESTTSTQFSGLETNNSILFSE